MNITYEFRKRRSGNECFSNDLTIETYTEKKISSVVRMDVGKTQDIQEFESAIDIIFHWKINCSFKNVKFARKKVLLKLYYKNNESAAVTFRKFRSKKNDV